MSASVDIYQRLREVSRLFATAKAETDWVAFSVRTRRAWDPEAQPQRLITSEEMNELRARLEEAIGVLVGIRSQLSTSDLDPLREAVRAAKAELDAIETAMGSVP